MADNNEEHGGVPPDYDYLYQPNFSTFCIFYQTPTTDQAIMWREDPPFYPSFPPPTTTIFSSSRGLLLSHTHSTSTSTSTYFVGNPFTNIPYYRSFHPHLPHNSETQAVITTSGRRSFSIISLIPNPTQEGSMPYAIETYSSRRAIWRILSHMIHIDDLVVDRFIIPNSGVSCRRYGYWLTWSETSSHRVVVVRVDPKFELLTYARMPRQEPGDLVVGMKLGRVGKHPGLVLVNETKRRVELYILIERRSVSTGNEDADDVTIMDRWVRYPEFLHVDVDPTMDESVVVQIVEPLRIRCREMPQPTKFESYKMEVLLLVGRRLVLWESRHTELLRSRVVVTAGEILAGDEQHVAIRGVPYVASSTRSVSRPSVQGLQFSCIQL